MDRRTFVLGAAGALLTTSQIAQLQASENSGEIVVGILGNEGPSSPGPGAMAFGVATSNALVSEIEAVTKAAYASRVRCVNVGGTDVESLSVQAPRLLGQKTAVIVAVGTRSAIAAARATKGLPIVMVGVADPVALGLVRSLARPDGDITGVSLLGPEILEKSLDFLREAAPSIKRAAVLWNPSNPGAALSVRHMQLAATAKGLNFVSVPVEQAAQLDEALTDLMQLQHDALVLIDDPVFLARGERILTYCSERRLPTMFSTAGWVTRGGLMSYEPQAAHMYRRAAAYVARILGGAKPRDLPVEQPTLFSFVLNMKAANALGLTIPPSLLLRADQVIE
ncbi:MAG TPA: ABC transporter substrate-binding protein [Candidatus Nitrosotalea sp.]|jgi:putative ABC transport system substrate-binding protein|nr:ABC transporter substrate-binding protein [Candidatus Nitrosotalea sp.]